MPYLAFNLNDGNEFIFDLLEDRLTLGRHASNDIVIDNTFISAHHAEFIRSDPGRYELLDLKSSNGTFVNGTKIDRCPIKGGDQLRFGQLTAKFRDRAPKGLGATPHGRPASQTSVKGPSRTEDHRGDTEAVTLPQPESNLTSEDALSTAPSHPQPASASHAVHSADIASMELARADLARLAQEKKVIETELATVARDRDESGRIRSELAALQSDLARAKEELAEAATVAVKLSSARRELSNLDNKRESTQHELDRAVADVEQAQKSLETIHREAEQARAKAATEQQNWHQQADERARERADFESTLRNLKESIQTAEAALKETVERQAATREAAEKGARAVAETLRLEREKEEVVLGKVRQEFEQLEAELSELREKGRAQHTLLVSLKEQENSIRTQINENEQRFVKQIESERAEMANLEHHKGVLHQVLAGLTSERDDTQMRLERLQVELAAFEERMTHQRTEETTAVARLTECRLQTEELLERGRQAEAMATAAQREEEKAREEIKALEQLLTEKRSTLDAESTRRLADLQVTEQKSEALLRWIVDQKSEADGLAAHLENTRNALKNAEQQRLHEEKEFGELAARQQQLKTEVGDLERLKSEENALHHSIQTLMQERSALESEVAEFRTTGGQILTLASSLAALSARTDEAERSLQKVTEQEREKMEQLAAVKEELNRETVRLKKLQEEQSLAEKDFTEFATILQREVSAMQQQEDEQKHRCAATQEKLKELEAKTKEQTAQMTALEGALKELKQRETECQEAENRLKQWQEVETRLRGQLVELEEKHDLMRSGLPTDEGTVIMFANDLIKRMDLIDSLRQRYAGSNGSDIGEQLLTLRASFEDILLQHSVMEFEIELGTEVDVDLRKRIAVVDSSPGKGKPRVVETYRSGYMFSREGSQETILRKVEVRTSSQ